MAHSRPSPVGNGFLLRSFGRHGAARALLWCALSLAACTSPVAQPDPTWTGRVEAIIGRRCASCHHSGGMAPFSLATYDEARRYSSALRAAVMSHRMPPWLPVDGYAEYSSARRLPDAERADLIRWVDAGTPRGNRRQTDSLVTASHWNDEWQLGTPDLVLQPGEVFTQPGTSRDVFRNLIVPVPVTSQRFVRAIELVPGRGGMIHHAIIQQDEERASRSLGSADGQPGFGGMDMGQSDPPDGHFLAWTPGKVPFVEPDGYAWRLQPGSDLIVQVHLPPSATPREIRPRIGLFFTDVPPKAPLAVVLLQSSAIDIQAGDSSYVVRDSLTLPVNVRALSVYPHAHFLATRMRGLARLPDGTERWLLRIDQWDFLWQDQYRFATPIDLPAGTTLFMEYWYDNSSSNPRNPRRPPGRVRFGNTSADEMATLSIQVELNPADRVALEEALALHASAQMPEDTEGLYALATVRLRQNRLPEAIALYRQLLDDSPGHVRALTNLGAALAMNGEQSTAAGVFRDLTERTPQSAFAWYNLGRALFESGQLDEARVSFQRSVALNGQVADSRNALAMTLLARRDTAAAVRGFRDAIGQDPSNDFARSALRALEARGSTSR